MEEYKKRFAVALAQTKALFFGQDLVLKDGRPTPYFVNMGMFRTGRFSLELGSVFAGMIKSNGMINDANVILGPSYKGSSIALATAISLWKDHGVEVLYEYDRKEAKTHGEASLSKSMFVNGSMFDGCRIFVVDDVATSMSTKYDILDKIAAEADNRNIKCRVIGLGIGIDRQQTTAVYSQKKKLLRDKKGKNAIQEFVLNRHIPVFSVAGIREILEYLYQEKIPVTIEGNYVPIDEKTMDQAHEYFKLYGTD
jgi:orotate phosphoribosyltransferase